MCFEGPHIGYTDLVITAGNVRLPPSSAPSTVEWRTKIHVLSFGQGEYVSFEGLRIPHGHVPAVTVDTVTLTNNAALRATMPPASLSGTTILVDAGTSVIDGTDIEMSAVAMGSLEHDATGTYTGECILASADRHIQLDRFGSVNEYEG